MVWPCSARCGRFCRQRVPTCAAWLRSPGQSAIEDRTGPVVIGDMRAGCVPIGKVSNQLPSGLNRLDPFVPVLRAAWWPARVIESI